MKKTILSTLLMGLLGAGSAFALDLHGLYGGVSAGNAHGNISTNTASNEVTRQTASAFIGNQFTPAWSAELGLGTVFKTDGTSAVTSSLTGSYRYALASTPVSLLATAGVASTYVESNTAYDFHLSPVVGLGAEYALNQRWSVRADYRVMNSFGANSNRVETSMLGLKAKF